MRSPTYVVLVFMLTSRACTRGIAGLSAQLGYIIRVSSECYNADAARSASEI